MNMKYLRHIVAGIFIGAGSMSLAEPVELISHDGSVSVSGELIEFDGSTYTIRTALGNLFIDSEQVECLGAGCPENLDATGPTVQDLTVELVSLDGNVTLSGELLDYDGSLYTLGTILGNLTVDALQVQCIGAACPVREEGTPFVRASGTSSIIADLMPRLLSDFSDSVGGELLITMADGEEDILSVLDGGGEKVLDMALTANQATTSLNDLLEGRANIAVLTRAANTRERAAFLAAGLGDIASPEQQIIFGLDGVVIVTSARNPIRALSREVLAQVFSGEIVNWRQIGGPDAPIDLFIRAEDTGTGTLFNTNIMVPQNRTFSAQSTVVESDAELAALVAEDPLAIGFTGLANVGNAKILNIRDACGIQVPATPFTIKTEEYPLTSRLYVYSTNEHRSPQLTRFLEFLASDAAQDAVVRSGLVDLGVSFQSNNEQGLRYLAAIVQTDGTSSINELRDMTRGLLASDRLSLTLRFATGSAELDDRARDDIQRLVRHITTNDLVNKELLLVGFTDSVGNPGANVALSQQRSRSVYNSLLTALPENGADGLPIISLGFGELSPLICNDTASGRRVNRRVEVWLRDTVSISN